MNQDSLIEENFRLNDGQKKALKKLKIKTIKDLLYYFPTRYGDISKMQNISGLRVGENAVVFGKISGLKTGKAFIRRTPMAEAFIEDETGKIKAIWFHQPYIAKMIHEGVFVRLDGKITERKGILGMINPKIETVVKIPTGVGDSLFGSGNDKHSLYPVYPESRGVSSNWIYHAIQKIFSARGESAPGGNRILDLIKDPIPEYILNTYNLPSLKTAMIWIHSPQKESDATSARKRFAFEEVFFIQLERHQDRMEWQKNPSFLIKTRKEDVEEFIRRFPFEATDAQKKAIFEIFGDFGKGYAMARLLEGDVGSGKTAVAAATAFGIVTTKPDGKNYGNLQVAYMAPTEILAKQHFESFIQYFTYLGISIGLITGSGCKKFPSKVNPKGSTDISRAQLLKWVANGEIPILIGTHTLIQKSVKFKNLAYTIIDEQHRFGTAQRQKLMKKPARPDDNSGRSGGEGQTPHLLSMTATPIPRTLALTIYGDLDLTLLDQMPVGRKSIITEVVFPKERGNTYEKIRVELKSGRQVYIICPRIYEPDPDKEMAVNAKSVIEEAKRLKENVFQEYEIGILHSKMKPDEKDKIMEDFVEGKINILVATSVIEVGVNVPNATNIIIEGAERFGLAQLHQLRGRVLRSNYQAYCYIFADTKSEKTVERMKALITAKNGFELAELDLKFRGSGALSGTKQWGITDIGMEAIKNIKMVEAARAEAMKMLEDDETFSKQPLIKETLSHRKKEQIHFE